MITINYLLLLNGLPLTIMLNPNRLDGFSIDELVSEIKTGQDLFKKVLASDGKHPIVIPYHEKIIDLKTEIVLPPFKIPDIDDSLLDEFSNTICQVSTKFSAAIALRNEIQDIVGKIPKYAVLVNDIGNGLYGKALRNACNNGLYDVIEAIVKYKEPFEYRFE